MAEIVYALCTLMSIVCAVLLFRGQSESGSKLRLWSAISFTLLALNNILLFIDLVVIPDIEFQGIFWRNLLASGGGAVLLYGLIWELT